MLTMLLTALVAAAGQAGAPSAPATPGTVAPSAPTAPSATPAAATDAEALLARLETADRGLRSFTAQAQRIKTFSEIQGGGRHIWQGELWFESPAAAGDLGAPLPNALAPRRRFAVVFTKEVVDNAVRERRQAFVFDGAWLLERDDQGKQFVRRRVVQEGETKDPLKIGEGPFPLPIGQRAADLRSRFTVELVEPLEGVADESPRFRELLTGCYQLRLTPLAGSLMERDFRQIKLWYRRDDLLPVLARTLNTDGSSDQVLLVRGQRNADIPAGTFDASEPPAADGWVGRTETPRDEGQRRTPPPVVEPPTPRPIPATPAPSPTPATPSR